MFMGIYTPVQKGQRPEQGWPEHAIELGWVELTPPSGSSVGMARHRQTVA